VADFISFNEGRKEIANNGLPATCTFDLSSRDCNTHVVGDTFGGGYGVITGTGYAAQTEAEPTASAANPSVIAFAIKTWATGAATDWPASVKSVVMRDAGKIYCAWNLVTGGTARAMNAASTTENFTPTLNVA
jgi:hypothetical protein